MKNLERKEKIILLSALGVVAFLVISTMAGIFLWRQSNEEEKLSDVQQILMNAAGNLAESTTRSTAEAMDSSLTMPVYYKMFQGPNTKFSKYETVTKYGPSADKCMGVIGYRYSDKDQISESRTYTDPETNKYYYYNEIKLADGEVVDLVIQTGEHTIYYSGGKYAVKVNDGAGGGLLYDSIELNREEANTGEIIADEGQTEPGYSGDDPMLIDPAPIDPEDPNTLPTEEEPVVDLSTLEALFGVDAVLVKEMKYDGKDVYVIQAYTEGYCDSPIEKRELDTTMITNEGQSTRLANEYLITTGDFQIVSTKIFINEFSEENLIQEVTNRYEGSDVDFAQVEDQFKFDKKVEVKIVSYPTFTTRKDEMNAYMNHLSEKGLKVLAPISDTFTLTSGWSQVLWTPEGSDYNTDSDFYSSSEVGRKRFKEMNADQGIVNPVAIVTLDFSNTQQSEDASTSWNFVNVNYYSQAEYQSLKDQYKQDYKVENVNVKIDGQDVAAERIIYGGYGVSDSKPVDSPEAEIMPLIENATINEYVYIFKYQGLTISITSNVDLLELRALDLKDQSEKAVIDGMIEEFSDEDNVRSLPVAE